MTLNRFDAIFYINLKHREDRRDHFLNELKKLNVDPSKIIRIDAFQDPFNGHRGCVFSHLKALDYAQTHLLSNAVIFEDDFVFLQTKESIQPYIETLFSSEFNDWDIFFMGTNVIHYEGTLNPLIKRVTESQAAHGYAINSPYFETLKNTFLYSFQSLNTSLFLENHGKHLLDQAWKPLQKTGKWYVANCSIGKQSDSFSDITYTISKRSHPLFYP
ncbi:MAG: hypothetical protein K9M07_06290 [Simkaniaceae bacterium]|nr:hypothetical protein [Simkaniaceae bacterium]MCF7852831.1 hypothetical protein [Simkaniaceae bacterium]